MDDIFTQSNVGLIKVNHWESDGVIAGFTTRKHGVSESPYDSLNVALHVNDDRELVYENRKLVSKWLNRPLNEWICVNQVHGNSIIDLSNLNDTKQFHHNNPKVDADGLLTNNPEHLLVCFYADCVPLYFKSKRNDWVGLAHAGWRGTVNKIGKKMVELLIEKGLELEDIEVVIGPSISSQHYEVDEKVINFIPERYRQNVMKETRENHFLLDLKRLNYKYLVDAGININHIMITNYCTYKDREMFFSHRRDQGRTGRMMAYIGINNT